MYYIAQLIYVKFNFFISNLIVRLIYIINENVNIINFYVVYATIEYLLYRVVIIANYTLIN